MTSNGTVEFMCVSRGCMQGVCPLFIATHSHIISMMPLLAQNSRDPCRGEISETPHEYKSRVLHLQLSTGCLRAPKGQASLLNQDILQVQKELSVILRKVNDERTFLSYLCYFLVLTNHWNLWWEERKRQNSSWFFSFQPFLSHQWAKGRACW